MSGKVALLVTPGTARGEKLAALIDRYGAEVAVQDDRGARAGGARRGGRDQRRRDAGARAAVVAPVRTSGADVLALGCTHYAFLRDVIEEEAGDGVLVIEPSAAIAQQVKRVLAARRIAERGRRAARGVP